MAIESSFNFELPSSDAPPPGCIQSHFLDSGSFSLWTRSREYAKENNCTIWDYYDTPEFWDYVDRYASFIKQYHYGIDFYSNVDAIPNPELTYRNQKHLEKVYGLTPIPVVHFPTDLKWLQRYIDEGYEYISLGGMVGSTSQENCRSWIDKAFDLVCDTPSRMPKVKIHGFGISVYSLMRRYPWYSVDSTTWTKSGAFGTVLFPHKRKGKFTFDDKPYALSVSQIHTAAEAKREGRPSLKAKVRKLNSVLLLSKLEREIITEWMDYIGIALGEIDDEGRVVKHGIITRHVERRAANVMFFFEMVKTLPEWPWPFTSTKRKGFGL